MADPAHEPKAVRFGPFQLDLCTCCLMRKGQQERLALQPSRLLVLLVQRRGELVTREELRSQLWPGDTFGDFDHGLNNAVNRLREALRDSAASPRYIQTVPRRGYRFIADVEPVVPALAAKTVPAPLGPSDLDESRSAATEPGIADGDAPPVSGPEAVRKPGTFSLRRWLFALVALCIVVVALLVRLRPARVDTKVDPGAAIRSLAVLPLQNLSGHADEEYFADGMTDALITALAHTPNLRVVSRTSVMQEKGSKKSLREIASELNVDAVVEGSVVRSGDRIRITAQLIDARSDRHLWAGSFEDRMSDVLELQDKVVGEIATQSQGKLAIADDNHAFGKMNPAAYDAYLRGLYFLHLRNGSKSAMYFRQAITLDPVYPAAYAGLADALTSERVLAINNLPDTEAQAKAAAERAIELDPHSGEAYSALGFVEITYHQNWAAGGPDLEKGLELNPNDSFAELQYSLFLDAVGRPEEAVAHMRRGQKLDPLSFVMNRHLGAVLYFDRQYKEALVSLDHALEIEPRNIRLVENWRSRSYEMLGQFDDAERSDLQNLTAWLSEAKLKPLRAAYKQGGWNSYQTARIVLLSKEPQLACGSYEIGEGYLRLGDRARAFNSISRGIDTSCFWSSWIAVDPMLDNLRSDPGYPGLLKRVNLPLHPSTGPADGR